MRIHSSLPISQGKLSQFTEDTLGCMQEMKARHGDVSALEEDGTRLHFAFGPRYNQQIFTDTETFHSFFFSIRGNRNSAQRRLTGGLLNMNGTEHKKHRRLVMSPFQKRTLINYHEPIGHLAEEQLNQWKPGEVRDMDLDMRQFLLRVTSALLFGLGQPDLAYRIGHMIDQWVEMNHETVLGALVSDELFFERYDRLLTHAKKLEAEIVKMIRLRRESAGVGTDLLSLLIHAHDQAGQVDDDKLIGQTALIFGAAHLTTAHTLTWTLFMLAQHPSVMQELHEEIRTKVKGTSPTREEVEQLHVTKRVIKESMRVMPASAYLQRTATRPVEVGPLTIPAGSPVIISQFMTHHMPELYPDPHAFRPSRWETIAPTPYEYLPFGAGPRMCIGGPLALVELGIALPTILKRYRLSVVPHSEINARGIATMLCPTTEISMLISDQDGRFESQPFTGNVRSMVDFREVPGTSQKMAA